jgi:hypothetical protein
MSMTVTDTRHWHGQYQEADAATQEAVDDAYNNVRNVLVGRGLPVNNSDAAEELVAAIYKYIVRSKS